MRWTTLLIVIFALAFGGSWWTHLRLAEAHLGNASYKAPIPSPTSNRKIDEYGDISSDAEKARLDNLAIELQNDPTAQGYIIAYGGRRAHPHEALNRATRAKRYLVESRGIPAQRIVTLDGGYCESMTVEVFVIPSGTPPPSSTPTVDPSEVKIIRRSKLKTHRHSRPRSFTKR